MARSFEDVLQQVQKFLRKLRKKYQTGMIVIVVADPLAKIIASQLSSQMETTSRNGESPVEVAACGCYRWVSSWQTHSRLDFSLTKRKKIAILRVI